MTKNAVAKSFDMYPWPDGSQRTKPYIDFPLNTWVDITPAAITQGASATCLMQGIAYDVNRPGTIYVCNGPFTSGGGLYKTVNGGEDWVLLASGLFDNPLHIYINPLDSDQLYATASVRGTGQGIWRSFDAGDTWERNTALESQATIDGVSGAHDVYDIGVDPSDWNNIVAAFHTVWGGVYGSNSGAYKTTNWTSWTIIPPVWTGTGHAIQRLYSPSNSIGNSSTWMVGTQDNSDSGTGFWRTTDDGSNFTRVSTVAITHGGQRGHYALDSYLYMAGLTTQRSSFASNGAAWTSVLSDNSYIVKGDLNSPTETLVTSKDFYSPDAQFKSSTDGTTWGNFSSTTWPTGIFDMAWDETKKVLFASILNSGVFARRMYL